MDKKWKIIPIAGFILAVAVAAYFFRGNFLAGGKKEVKIDLNKEIVKDDASNPENTIPEDTNSAESASAENSQKEASASQTDEQKNNTVEKSPAVAETQSSLAADEPAAPAFSIKNNLVSWGYQKSSDRKIDTIIIHSTYNALGGDEHSLGKILDIYKSYGVSPHYIIYREGKIYRLVEEKNIAYHAGESSVPDGRTNVNNFSIGIEVIETASESPSSAQYSFLKRLIADIKSRYKIKYVLGHSDISPGRKTDPWNFDWGKIK